MGGIDGNLYRSLMFFNVGIVHLYREFAWDIGRNSVHIRKVQLDVGKVCCLFLIQEQIKQESGYEKGGL